MMAANSGNWEVVRKPQKKVKQNGVNNNNNKLSKAQVKEYMEKMPKLDQMVPLKESRTLFSAFIEKEKPVISGGNQQQKGKQSNKNQKSSSGAASQNKEKETKSKAAEKKATNKRATTEKKRNQEKPPKSLEEALEKLNVSELKSLMEMVRVRFPGSPNIWLKDLVAYLNVKLNVEVADPSYGDQGRFYPFSILPRGLLEIIEDALENCPEVVLQLFFERSVTEMVDDMMKGVKTHGYRILLQAIAHRAPHFVTSNLEKYGNLRNSYQNRPPVCISVLWVAGQSGVVNFEAGLKVWMEIMLPILYMRAYSKYTVQYLCSLLRWHSSSSSAGAAIGAREFFSLMDTIFNNKLLDVLPGNVYKDLLNVYPKLKNLAFGPRPEMTLQNFFPSFLMRLQPSSPPALKNELLTSLTYCLKRDKHCYSIWRQLYTRHLVQSSLLLDHLQKNWEKISVTLPLPLLKETLGAFGVTNDEWSTRKSKSGQEGLLECKTKCKLLLARMCVSSRFPWRTVIFFVVTALSGLIIYDCQTHGSFKASKTGRILDDVGFLNASQHAWQRTKTYSSLSYQWTAKNVPIYVSSTTKFCEPYWKLVFAWFLSLATQVLEFLFAIHQLIVKSGPVFLQWVDNEFPTLYATIKSQLSMAMEFIGQVTGAVWRYAQLTGTWLHHNVFMGEMSVAKWQEQAYSVVDAVQMYTIETFQWINQQLRSPNK